MTWTDLFGKKMINDLGDFVGEWISIEKLITNIDNLNIIEKWYKWNNQCFIFFR